MEPQDRKNLGAAAAGLLGGLGGGLVTMAGPQVFPKAPPWVWEVTLYFGLVVFLGAIAYLLYEYCWRPRRVGKPKLDPLQIIGFVAALTLALVFGLQLIRGPYASAKGSSDVGVKPPLAVAAAEATPKLISAADFEWSGGDDVLLRLQFNETGEKLSVLIDLGASGFGTLFPLNVHANQFAFEQRMEIGFIERFAKGTTQKILFAKIRKIDERQGQIQWGEDKFQNPKRGANFANIYGRIVLVQVGKPEEHHPFALISRTFETFMPPVLIAPTMMSSYMDWIRDGK